MKPPKDFWLLVAIASVILLVMFHRLAEPNTVLFSNDAPLGYHIGIADADSANLTGRWNPLNWLGTAQPSGAPSLQNFMFYICCTPSGHQLAAALFLFAVGVATFGLLRKYRRSSTECILCPLVVVVLLYYL